MCGARDYITPNRERPTRVDDHTHTHGKSEKKNEPFWFSLRLRPAVGPPLLYASIAGVGFRPGGDTFLYVFFVHTLYRETPTRFHLKEMYSCSAECN